MWWAGKAKGSNSRQRQAAAVTERLWETVEGSCRSPSSVPVGKASVILQHLGSDARDQSCVMGTECGSSWDTSKGRG